MFWLKFSLHLQAQLHQAAWSTVPSNTALFHLAYLCVGSIHLRLFYHDTKIVVGSRFTSLYQKPLLKKCLFPRINVLQLALIVYGLGQVPALRAIPWSLENRGSTLLVLSLVASPGLGIESTSPKLWDLGIGKKIIGFSWKTKKHSPVEVGISAGQAERTGAYHRVEMTMAFMAPTANRSISSNTKKNHLFSRCLLYLPIQTHSILLACWKSIQPAFPNPEGRTRLCGLKSVKYGISREWDF